MQTITHAQVQDMVVHVPVKKLPTAYRLLAELTKGNGDSSPQTEFVLLSLEERRRIMQQQAQDMITHYSEGASENAMWEVGDFIDY